MTDMFPGVDVAVGVGDEHQIPGDIVAQLARPHRVGRE